MNKYTVYPAVATPTECALLTAWALASPSLSDGYGLGYERVASRKTNRNWLSEGCPRPEYPPLVYDIQRRLAALNGLSEIYDPENNGADGVVVVVTYDGGDSHSHLDGKAFGQFDVVRNNVLVSEAAGAKLYIEDVPVNDWHEGDAIQFCVSKQLHCVTPVTDAKPRVNFLFGWVAP